MTAPRWIAAAIEAATDTNHHPRLRLDYIHRDGKPPPSVTVIRDDRIAAALIERLPVEAIGAALAIPIAKLRDVVHRLRETSERAPDVRAVPMRLVHQSAFDDLIAYVGSGDCGRLAAVVRALAADHDAVTIAELYQGACKVLDEAGAPYEVATSDSEGNDCNRMLNLAGRIRWLAQQRPTRLDLQRLQSDRDAQIELRATAERERDAAREKLQLFIERVASAAQMQICNNADHVVTRVTEIVGVLAGSSRELDNLRARIAGLEGDAEVAEERLEAATGEAEHNERELVDLRRRFDDLQRDRDRLARDLNQLQGDLDTSERKLREAERELQRAR